MFDGGRVIEARLQSLESHLRMENPVLLDVVQSYRDLDRVGRRLGLLEKEESFASRISWWPLVAVLGTFSAGKSTFINYTLGSRLQQTGNQAVDDKFSVICYSRESEVNVLPGFALDADPRFPFYQISDKIEMVSEGEGRRIDAYLQLKTCPSEKLRGKILIDSPGFDADAQRTSTLRITDHIIDLADLVLVFFDARHPESGAMQDTLDHLVGKTVSRPDSSKFLYILNQIDTTAREDNPEEVFGAWQRALSQQGLTAGRFYAIYNPEAAIPIEDPSVRQRFESKRDADLAEIERRMQQVEVERAYRIVGALEKQVHDIEQKMVPTVSGMMADWRKSVIYSEIALAAAAVGGGAYLLESFAGWNRFSELVNGVISSPLLTGVVLIVLVAVLFYLHFIVRNAMRGRMVSRIERRVGEGFEREGLIRSFMRSTRPIRSLFSSTPAGWGGWARKRIRAILNDADRYVQQLNDQFTNPSGREEPAEVVSDNEVAAAGELELVEPNSSKKQT